MKITIILARSYKHIPGWGEQPWPESWPNLIVYPEANLHPTDVQLWLIRKLEEGKDMNIITHSEHIVNLLGRLVEQKVLNSNDIDVRLYDEKKNLSKSWFDSNGVLVDWPFGWLLPDMVEVEQAIEQYVDSRL